MNDIDGDAYMEFWRESIDNGTLTENVDSLPSVKESDEGVFYA